MAWLARSGTIIVILYVRGGFIIASDSAGTLQCADPMKVQKVFRVTDSMGCALMGAGSLEDPDTGRVEDLAGHLARFTATLQASNFSEAVKLTAEAYFDALKEAQTSLGATFSDFNSDELAEMSFAGFDGEIPTRRGVHFCRAGARLYPPIYGPPDRLTKPCQSVRYRFRCSLSLLVHDPSNVDSLPESFSLDEAEKLARNYVEAAINSGDPSVGEPIQVARIPCRGHFTFVYPVLPSQS